MPLHLLTLDSIKLYVKSEVSMETSNKLVGKWKENDISAFILENINRRVPSKFCIAWQIQKSVSPWTNRPCMHISRK